MHLYTQRTSHIVAICLLGINILLGCSKQSSSLPPSNPEPPPVAARPQVTTPPFPFEYADVAKIRLSDAELPKDFKLEGLSVEKGVAEALTIVDGQIRFFTPTDPGKNTVVTLKGRLDTKDVLIPIEIRTRRFKEIEIYNEKNEDGTVAAPATLPKLTVKGLPEDWTLQEGEWSFSVTGAPVLSVEDSSLVASFQRNGKNEHIEFNKLWTHNTATNSLVIAADKVKTLLEQLPIGDVSFLIVPSDALDDFRYAYTINAYKPGIRIQGQVLDAEGKPVTSLTGRRMALRGIQTENGIRQMVSIDADGKFSFEKLIPGTYWIDLQDTKDPNYWRQSAVVYPGSTVVTAPFRYTPLEQKKGSASAVLSGADPAISALFVQKQDGRAPQRKDRSALAKQSPQKATPSSCETPGADGATTYTVAAGQEDQEVTCSISHTVIKGTSKLGIDVIVSSAEYPNYTTQKSEFNDVWGYTISGLPQISGDAGAVNDTHYTQGTVKKSVCIDVASLAKEADFNFTAALRTKNIGDSILPTTVVMEVKPCEEKLRVTAANFKSPNSSGYAVIKPLIVEAQRGNLDGNYISVPINSAQSAWGIPLDVKFEPERAKITKVRLGILQNGSPVMASDDLSGQVTQAKPGELTLNSVIIPKIPIAPFVGKTEVVVELTGTVDTKESISEPKDGAIKFNGDKTFTPLFSADELVGAGRRYGSRDAGGDSWATIDSIQWLQSRAYRFDDISALHVAQVAATGRSVIDHAGHSDGTQIDMRYSDGTGGYTDAMGGVSNGAAILATLNAAAAEVAQNPQAKPNLQKITDWIIANRAMLSTEASSARYVWAGPSWMRRALEFGKFPNGAVIPNIGAWTNKPANVGFIAPHLHHWHISR